MTSTELARNPIKSVLTCAPGDDAPIGGMKVLAASGWFAARPSGTEDIDRIYAESCRDAGTCRPSFTSPGQGRCRDRRGLSPAPCGRTLQMRC
jgi:hypothetical protein